jgi:hypothetical protein
MPLLLIGAETLAGVMPPETGQGAVGVPFTEMHVTIVLAGTTSATVTEAPTGKLLSTTQ